MNTKALIFSDEVRSKILEGVKKASDAISCTLGPKGRHVILERRGQPPRITKDGVSVAKEIHLEDCFENMGAELLAEVSNKTCRDAGDGTTTSSLLTYHLIYEGIKAIQMGSNPVDLRRGIESALKDIIDFLKSFSFPILEDNKELNLRAIAKIAANGDVKIGNLLADAFKEIGKVGSITLVEGRTIETTLEYQHGINLDFGYDPFAFSCITHNDTKTCEYKDPYIFFHDADVKEEKIKYFIEEMYIKERDPKQPPIPIIFIAQSFDGNNVIPIINANNSRGISRICPVNLPPMEDPKISRKQQYDFLSDFCILTNGKMMEREEGDMFSKHISQSYFGRAEAAVVSRNKLTIMGGKGDPKLIERQRMNLEQELAEYEKRIDKEENYEKHLITRIQHFKPMAIIRAGGMTPVEISERKDRIEDAMHATKAAIESGFVPGGGIALLRASDALSTTSKNDDVEMGRKIVKKALKSPFNKILQNAGYNSDSCYKQITISDSELDKKNHVNGINADNGEVCNMIKEGIIDPTDVVISCVQNAVSIAGLLLTTETMIAYYDKDPNPLSNMKLKI